MSERTVTSLRVDPILLKEVKKLAIDLDKDLADLTDEGYKMVIKKYKS